MYSLLPQFIRERAELYHARGAEYLSSHALLEFSHCPLQYRRKIGGLAIERVKEFYDLGRAAHVLIAEGHDAFHAEYIVGGPVNPKTDKCYGKDTQAYAKWAEQQTKAVIDDSEFALICNLATAVHPHAAAAPLFRGGVCEGVIRADYCGVPCQIRIDYFQPDFGIIDLKTCDNLDRFETAARLFNYPRQLAFYRSVLRSSTAVTAPVSIVAVEKCEPHRVGVWHLSTKLLAIAEIENESAIEELKRARIDDHWPTHYEIPRTLDVLPPA